MLREFRRENMALGKVIVTGVSLVVASAAVAGPASDKAENRFENRLARQDDRIDHGVEAGRIGPREAQALNREQAALDRALDRQTADGGRLTRGEAYRLENRFDRSSRAIRLASARPRG
jgi:hypothetical protein